MQEFVPSQESEDLNYKAVEGRNPTHHSRPTIRPSMLYSIQKAPLHTPSTLVLKKQSYPCTRHDGTGESGGVDPSILKFDTIWM